MLGNKLYSFALEREKASNTSEACQATSSARLHTDPLHMQKAYKLLGLATRLQKPHMAPPRKFLLVRGWQVILFTKWLFLSTFDRFHWWEVN